MFEVLLIGNRWTWRMICPAGRPLVYTSDTFDDMGGAAEAAKAYRAGFWLIADQVDHRMGRCI